MLFRSFRRHGRAHIPAYLISHSIPPTKKKHRVSRGIRGKDQLSLTFQKKKKKGQDFSFFDTSCVFNWRRLFFFFFQAYHILKRKKHHMRSKQKKKRENTNNIENPYKPKPLKKKNTKTGCSCLIGTRTLKKKKKTATLKVIVSCLSSFNADCTSDCHLRTICGDRKSVV